MKWTQNLMAGNLVTRKISPGYVKDYKDKDWLKWRYHQNKDDYSIEVLPSALGSIL